MEFGTSQQHALPGSTFGRIRRLAFKAAVPLALAALSFGAFNMSAPSSSEAAPADHLMCGWRADYRTQTVSIDPFLASAGVSYQDVVNSFAPWNSLYQQYHGFAIFAPHYGNWWEADILVTAQGGPRTWVAGKCTPGFVQHGNNHTIVFLGSQDSWRNKTMLSHEMGHALGFADHGNGDASTGHIGFKPCGNYIGVMSYCTSPQSWFIANPIAGLFVDGELVRDYWR